jgi:hypothetical protein
VHELAHANANRKGAEHQYEREQEAAAGEAVRQDLRLHDGKRHCSGTRCGARDGNSARPAGQGCRGSSRCHQRHAAREHRPIAGALGEKAVAEGSNDAGQHIGTNQRAQPGEIDAERRNELRPETRDSLELKAEGEPREADRAEDTPGSGGRLGLCARVRRHGGR